MACRQAADLIRLVNMTNPENPKRTPLPNDPVGSLIGEFMEEKRREKQAELARAPRRGRNPVTVAVLVAVCLAVWIAPSLMLPPAPVPTAEMLERGARMTLYLTSLRIREFQDSTQRLPASLIETGTDTTGIVYWRSTDSVFELSTKIEGARLVYKSTLPDSVFLGGPRIRGIS